ncbi:M15 family metallopeptidase [Acinetobacter larvae]|uniref:D-alanyl-D-alanine dipeptidase n=1 Tax=Acinetobacter larvae TaxID=1789224 RepID=A0A1B2LWK2_9GAMM|nr:M15 family metallopeptidase [Acinetobacter larvae]AOA57321.1 hypothetical protein BFG52_02415 [Acinetobacter larvae]
MLQAIPSITQMDWNAVYQQHIIESGEPLVNLNDMQNCRIQVSAIYHQQGIPFAQPHCYARQSVAARLQDASTYLPAGYHLLILDAWRPYLLQKQLIECFRHDIMQKNPAMSAEQLAEVLALFVAEPSEDPLKPSPHLTGGSVDLTLCDEHGTALDMGTAFDEASEYSWTASFEQTQTDPTVQHNRRVLYWAMRHAGFTNLPTEWWHYDFGNQLWCYFSQQAQAIYSKTSV